MQTIKVSNRDAFEVVTLIERTIAKVEQQEKDASTLDFYKRLTSIKKSLDESCPELVKRWDDLQEVMHSVHHAKHVDGDWICDSEGITRFRKACEEFDKWLDKDE